MWAAGRAGSRTAPKTPDAGRPPALNPPRLMVRSATTGCRGWRARPGGFSPAERGPQSGGRGAMALERGNEGVRWSRPVRGCPPTAGSGRCSSHRAASAASIAVRLLGQLLPVTALVVNPRSASHKKVWFAGADCRLGPVANAHFLEQGFHMGFYCRVGDVQSTGDQLV
jgi:hypothetical protein